MTSFGLGLDSDVGLLRWA